MPVATLTYTLMVCLRVARKYALRAAHIADKAGDTERHERIMLALTALDDAIAPNRPLTEEVRELMEAEPNG
jgi:hypothetical protein